MEDTAPRSVSAAPVPDMSSVGSPSAIPCSGPPPFRSGGLSPRRDGVRPAVPRRVAIATRPAPSNTATTTTVTVTAKAPPATTVVSIITATRPSPAA